MSIRILLAEDHGILRAGLRNLLNAEPGLEVIGEASDGVQILEMAEQLHPDLILMDVVMPGQNGFQLTRAISRDPLYQDVPIIMCTSKNQETDKVWGMRQGARDYIVKPVDADELVAKIKAFD